MTTRFPRGSEWRRWDLHVHTPESHLHSEFGSDFDVYAHELFSRAVSAEIAVIGVTDYFSIEGYKKLKTLQSDISRATALLGEELAEKARGILLLPNVELRCSIIIDGSRVNFHVIFSDELLPRDIDEHFLRELKFTAEGRADDPDEQRSLTIQNLEDLGRQLKEQHPPFRTKSDIVVGMMTAVVDHESVSDALKRQKSRFGDRYLLVTQPDEDLARLGWNSQGHLARKTLYQKSHMYFSANPNTREFALGRRHDCVTDFEREFGRPKPCIHGSDAHKYSDLFLPAEQRLTWIKADPTFTGLRQLLNEPEHRVFIGPRPPHLLESERRPTKIVREVAIRKRAGSTLSEEWFNVALPLNGELTAIIGNKGSGKSALADVLGLLGATPRFDKFSFLNKEKFRAPRQYRARHFEAVLRWADGSETEYRLLQDNPEADEIETIRYIPQHYLEEICNEVEAGEESLFYDELQNIIFSHVPLAERLHCETLGDLLEYHGEEIDRKIRLLLEDLAKAKFGDSRHRATSDPSLPAIARRAAEGATARTVSGYCPTAC